MSSAMPLNLALILWMCLALCATILYIAVLVQLFRNRATPPFDSSFFKIWFNLGLTDIAMILYGWTFYRLPLVLDYFDLTSSHLFIGDTSIILIYFLHADMVGDAVLFINRYTSLCHATKHQSVCVLFLFIFISCCSYGRPRNCVLQSCASGVYHF
jgi:hypothetical protein